MRAAICLLARFELAQTGYGPRIVRGGTVTKKAKSAQYPPPDARQPMLAEIRRQKMARSPHAYERGTAAHFYGWVKSRAAGSLLEGPAVWICGDCHLGNLGPVADAEGQVAV